MMKMLIIIMEYDDVYYVDIDVYEVEDGLTAIAKRLKEGRKINATIIWRAK
jgi:hypothetical protein